MAGPQIEGFGESVTLGAEELSMICRATPVFQFQIIPIRVPKIIMWVRVGSAVCIRHLVIYISY